MEKRIITIQGTPEQMKDAIASIQFAAWCNDVEIEIESETEH